jgi:hypothetical protein
MKRASAIVALLLYSLYTFGQEPNKKVPSRKELMAFLVQNLEFSADFETLGLSCKCKASFQGNEFNYVKSLAVKDEEPWVVKVKMKLTDLDPIDRCAKKETDS